jgi:hypothetical protein
VPSRLKIAGSRHENGEGSGVLRRTPSFFARSVFFTRTGIPLRSKTLSRKTYQPACKPGSVGHHSLSRMVRDGHSSGTMFAHCLEQPTRTASLTSLPRVFIALQRTARVAVPIRSCSRCGLPCQIRCRTRGALLPHLFTLALRSSARSKRGRFILCGTVPGVAPAGCYPAPYVDGARTFLSSHLSAVAGAAVRPTDGSVMGV